jgi:hypothetical protein
MSQLDKKTLEAVQETIRSSGKLRLHLQTSRTGMTTKCRLWHYDGTIVGSASGYGYDKEGAALGQAIELLLAPELSTLWGDLKGKVYPTLADAKNEQRAMYGVSRSKDNGQTLIDGSCGTQSVLQLLNVLGYEVEHFATSATSSIVIITKQGK